MIFSPKIECNGSSLFTTGIRNQKKRVQPTLLLLLSLFTPDASGLSGFFCIRSSLVLQPLRLLSLSLSLSVRLHQKKVLFLFSSHRTHAGARRSAALFLLDSSALSFHCDLSAISSSLFPFLLPMVAKFGIFLNRETGHFYLRQ